MALRAILITRKLIPASIVTGGFLDLTSFNGGWPFMGVDYANEGSESDPPTLSYINVVDETISGNGGGLGTQIGVLLPLSAEGEEVQNANLFIQYHHPRWSRL
jgi:hypothetical protein